MLSPACTTTPDIVLLVGSGVGVGCGVGEGVGDGAGAGAGAGAGSDATGAGTMPVIGAEPDSPPQPVSASTSASPVAASARFRDVARDDTPPGLTHARQRVVAPVAPAVMPLFPLRAGATPAMFHLRDPIGSAFGHPTVGPRTTWNPGASSPRA